MKEELAKLVDLQKTDTKIRQLKKAINSATERRAGIEQEFEQHAFSIREIQKRRDDLVAQRTASENEIAETKTYLDRADRNLSTPRIKRNTRPPCARSTPFRNR